MMKLLKAISLSHRNSPVEIRESVALNQGEASFLLHKLSEVLDLEEVLVLSTCNRTEIYYTSESDKSPEIIKILAIEKNIAPAASLIDYFDIIDNQSDAIRHLFRVSIGLDSQVLGDIQITNQVKKAYQLSADTNLAGPLLHRLMHTIFFTNKRVVQETSFKDGAASVSYASVRIIEDICANIIAPHILVIGTGEIGQDVVRNLKDSGFEGVTVVNRTKSKAEEIADECGYTAGNFEALHELIHQSDVIVSSVGTELPVITFNQLQDLLIPGYKHFFDLGVPRSIDPEIERIPGVSLHNIDDIQVKTNEALEKRKQSIERVEEIIDESIGEFSDWSKEMLVSPAIKNFKNALEDIRKEELKKYLKKLDPEQARVVDKITKSLMQKVVKLPALNLKAACKRDEAESLVDVLNELFDLEKQKTPKQY